jgi:hypothetical protein
MRWTVGALTGAAVLVLAAGCNTAPDGPDAAPSGQPGNSPSGQTVDPRDQPKTVNVAAALEVSTQEFALLKKGDWAGAWALWTDTAKKEVPEDLFVKVNKACPAALKRDYQLQDVKPFSNELIEVTFRRGDIVERGALRAIGDGWRFDPGATMLVDYASGADAAVAKRKAAKQC